MAVCVPNAKLVNLNVNDFVLQQRGRYTVVIDPAGFICGVHSTQERALFAIKNVIRKYNRIFKSN